ncbi:hypothetical protein B6U93_04495 [Candidatus Woesearchaeota archaeon ex4484_78]|nr:MAG: hypothetical protein B6U93_04495 [Candidatus Woesearchaeota archaeon ex4484_78]
MDIKELMKSKEELEKIAEIMSEEIKKSKKPGETVVSRYFRVVQNSAGFYAGKKFPSVNTQANLNKETRFDSQGVYFNLTDFDDVFLYNFKELTVARDLFPVRFQFYPKEISLPLDSETFFEEIPNNVSMYDEEFRSFTEKFKNTKITRDLNIEQRIVVNSEGSVKIQSVPFFSLTFSSGYAPVSTFRSFSVVCNSDDDLKRLTDMIKFISDPTLDKRIQNARTFSEAFRELYLISPLVYSSLEEAGIQLSEVYDPVMLSGTPVHEIFGHHFEEPIRFLNFGETGTFMFNQNLRNKDLIMSDDPIKRIAGFRSRGFTYFDAYGRKRNARVHIKDGKVQEFLGSEYIDQKNLKQFLNLEKSEFVGNASQYLDGAFPQPRMSCTVLEGPSESVDLEGKILLVPNNGHTNEHDKTYMVQASECYVVKDGEPRRTIPLKVTGGILQAMANIILLDDISYNVGVCGKPEPINFASSAHIPVSEYTKSQIWAGQQIKPSPISEPHLKIIGFLNL